MKFNKKFLAIVSFALYSMTAMSQVFADEHEGDEEDDPCAVVVDLEEGEMYLPCVDLYGDALDEKGNPIPDGNGGHVQEVKATYSVEMEQRGNSMNWKVTFVELEYVPDAGDAGTEEADACSSKVELDSGVLYMPCLQLDLDGDGEGEGEIFEVYMDMSQRGNSSNWAVKLINNENGEEIYYRHGDDDDAEDEDDEEDDDCPSANASDKAKANHPECVYDD